MSFGETEDMFGVCWVAEVGRRGYDNLEGLIEAKRCS